MIDVSDMMHYIVDNVPTKCGSRTPHHRSPELRCHAFRPFVVLQ
jgi:hypothetical protein